MVFFMFNDLRYEIFVRFVGIGGNVDIHCLNFLFIYRSIYTIDRSAYFHNFPSNFIGQYVGHVGAGISQSKSDNGLWVQVSAETINSQDDNY
jgi:hypothetical protein